MSCKNKATGLLRIIIHNNQTNEAMINYTKEQKMSTITNHAARSSESDASVRPPVTRPTQSHPSCSLQEL